MFTGKRKQLGDNEKGVSKHSLTPVPISVLPKNKDVFLLRTGQLSKDHHV